MWKDPVRVAEALRATIRKEVGITASVGVAPNKFLAKLASDLNKPDGLSVVPDQPDEIRTFLAPMPVAKIWGVGKKGEQRLREAGIRTIGDVQARGRGYLESVIGPTFAAHVHALAFGEDDRPVVTSHEAKSISTETTFDEDCSDADTVRETVIQAAEQVGRRLRADGRKARVAHIKLRYGDFETLTRQQALEPPTTSDRRLIQAGLELLGRESLARPVRLVGFGVSGLGGDDPSRELYLFQDMMPGREDERDGRIDRAVDAVRARFGEGAVRRGR